MKKITKIKVVIMALCLFCLSCKKYLDEKPSSDQAVPTTITDLQLLMDNYAELNSRYPVAAEILADDYYTAFWNNLPENVRETYIWGGKEFDIDAYWFASYQRILTCNVVLDHVDKVTYKNNEAQLVSYVKGSALFFRAFYYYGLAQLYAKPYDLNIAKDDPGIVLRSSSDFNIPSVRASNAQTYQKIITNLKESAALLPDERSSPNRPVKSAAYGLLARAYLGMKQYDSAGYYANKTLEKYASLIDYNSLNQASANPFSRFNIEVIFPMTAGIMLSRVALVDSNLFRSYVENDLRKPCFYHLTGSKIYRFKGNYDGDAGISNPNSAFVFAGIATDEMYLIKAECQARTGNINEAMQTLNVLLIKRWKTGTFVPFTASNVNDALAKILRERRKELVFRTVRWEDLRRLQNDPLFSITPKRIVNGQEYSLPPNSPRYLMKIPPDVIQLSGIPQNP